MKHLRDGGTVLVAAGLALALGACSTTSGIFGSGLTPATVNAGVEKLCGAQADAFALAEAISANPGITTVAAWANFLCGVWNQNAANAPVGLIRIVPHATAQIGDIKIALTPAPAQ